MVDWIEGCVDLGNAMCYLFFTISLNLPAGESVGLLALNTLFVLTKGYICSPDSFSLYPVCVLNELCLPSDCLPFYTRLYGFLDRDVLHLKHGFRLFRLTELFRSSTYADPLSGNFLFLLFFIQTSARFCLQYCLLLLLSRLSLMAPPGAIVIGIPFTYDILKRHRALMVMIHRVDVVTEKNGGLHLFLRCLLSLQNYFLRNLFPR